MSFKVSQNTAFDSEINQQAQHLLSPWQEARASSWTTISWRLHPYTFSPLMSPRHISLHHHSPKNLSSSTPCLGFTLPDRCLEQLLKLQQRVCINLLFLHTLHFKVFRQQQKTIKGNSELRLKRTICFQAEGHKTSVNHCRDYILPLSGIERLQNNVISNY